MLSLIIVNWSNNFQIVTNKKHSGKMVLNFVCGKTPGMFDRQTKRLSGESNVGSGSFVGWGGSSVLVSEKHLPAGRKKMPWKDSPSAGTAPCLVFLCFPRLLRNAIPAYPRCDLYSTGRALLLHFMFRGEKLPSNGNFFFWSQILNQIVIRC